MAAFQSVFPRAIVMAVVLAAAVVAMAPSPSHAVCQVPCNIVRAGSSKCRLSFGKPERPVPCSTRLELVKKTSAGKEVCYRTEASQATWSGCLRLITELRTCDKMVKCGVTKTGTGSCCAAWKQTRCIRLKPGCTMYRIKYCEDKTC